MRQLFSSRLLFVAQTQATFYGGKRYSLILVDVDLINQQRQQQKRSSSFKRNSAAILNNNSNAAVVAAATNNNVASNNSNLVAGADVASIQISTAKKGIRWVFGGIYIFL